MNIDYPLDYEPATPQYVLALLRIAMPNYVGVDSGVDVDCWTLDAPFREWCADWNGFIDDSFDFTTCELDFMFEEQFGIAPCIPQKDWRQFVDYFVDDGAPEMTLGHLCAFIARYIFTPRIRPLIGFGQPSLAAGAFMSLRSLMAETGVDVGGLRPSTPIDDFARRHWREFDTALKIAAPLARPDVVVVKSPRQRIHDAFHAVSSLSLCGAIMLALYALFAFQKLGAQAATVLAIAYACWKAFEFFHPLAWLTSGGIPAKVSLGPLRTFRDLSDYLAARAV